MIFAHTLEQVLSGRKIQTRRIVKTTDEKPKWQPGRDYAVQPGRGKKAMARIKALEVRQEPLSDISEADAWAEGFRNRAEFIEAWREMHGNKALEAHVWVITFELVRGTSIRITEAIARHADELRSLAAKLDAGIQKVEAHPFWAVAALNIDHPYMFALGAAKTARRDCFEIPNAKRSPGGVLMYRLDEKHCFVIGKPSFIDEQLARARKALKDLESVSAWLGRAEPSLAQKVLN